MDFKPTFIAGRNYSIVPFTLAWFIVLTCTLITTLLYRSFRHEGMGEQCLLISHISVAVYIVCVFVVLGVILKKWIVRKEQAGAGRDCLATRLVSIWDILGLVQWKIGTVVMVMVGCFGKDWYDACLVG
jgi:hypothetical protein